VIVIAPRNPPHPLEQDRPGAPVEDRERPGTGRELRSAGIVDGAAGEPRSASGLPRDEPEAGADVGARPS